VDLVITDRFMPFMDGLLLVRRMRAEPRLRNVPVVMVSADDAPGAAQQALQLGVSVYLRKPVNVLDVVRTAEALLRRRP
jgi:CheY-like chemotaxis protein